MQPASLCTTKIVRVAGVHGLGQVQANQRHLRACKGDKALTVFAKQIQAMCRDEDIFARLGVMNSSLVLQKHCLKTWAFGRKIQSRSRTGIRYFIFVWDC